MSGLFIREGAVTITESTQCRFERSSRDLMQLGLIDGERVAESERNKLFVKRNKREKR